MIFDLTIFNAIFSLANRSEILDGVIILFGRWWGVVIAAGLVVYLLRPPRERVRAIYAIWAIVGAAIARYGIVEIVRLIFDRARPFEALPIEPLFEHAPNAGFPSGHATFFMALAIYFLLLGGRRERKFGWFLFGSAILVGLARVAAGVHWPTDVLVGWVIGAAVSLIVWFFAVRKGQPESPRTI